MRRRLLLLLVLAACTPGREAGVPPAALPVRTTEERIAAIEEEVGRIDAIIDASETDLQRLGKDLPHWQLYGVFQRSTPIFLDAIYSAGSLVRKESYYLRDRRPLRMSLERFWDVDDDWDAREPLERMDLYLDGDRAIRRVVEVATSPSERQTDDAERPARVWVERAAGIERIIRGEIDGTFAADILDAFPDGELP